MKYQKKYYIRGTILLVLAMLFATVIPAYFKIHPAKYVEDYMFIVMKFILLTACGVYYLFSPKYYKEQILDIITAMVIYLMYITFIF